MLTDFETLIAALHARMSFLEAQGLPAEVTKQDPGLRYLSRCFRRYFAAEHAAPKYGWIGVGAISFAEHRLEKFERRAQHLRPHPLTMPCADKPARIKLTRGGF